MMFRKFTEYNEHEGEKWNFFIAFRKAEELEYFGERIAELNDVDDTYSISVREYTLQEVLVLCKEEGDTTYMNQYNLCGWFDIEAMKALSFAELQDKLYKGGIMNGFCKPIENIASY